MRRTKLGGRVGGWVVEGGSAAYLRAGLMVAGGGCCIWKAGWPLPLVSGHGCLVIIMGLRHAVCLIGCLA